MKLTYNFVGGNDEIVSVVMTSYVMFSYFAVGVRAGLCVPLCARLTQAQQLHCHHGEWRCLRSYSEYENTCRCSQRAGNIRSLINVAN